MIDEDDKQVEDGDDEDIEPIETDDTEETIVMKEMPVADSSGGDTVEMNVDKMIEKVEAQSEDEVHRKKQVRQRLEELAEEGSFEDTYAIDVEDAD